MLRKRGFMQNLKANFYHILFFFLYVSFNGIQAQDQVFLRSGKVFQGKISDPGKNYILLQSNLGQQRIRKRDILKIELGRIEAKTITELDRIELSDGRVVKGEVRVSVDGKSIIVRIPGSGEAIYSKKDVVRIIPRGAVIGDRPAAGPEEIKLMVKKLVDKLNLGGSSADKAEKKLCDLGIFALEPLHELSKDAKGEVSRRIRKILRVYELKKMVGDTLDKEFPVIYEGLEDPEASRRIQALKGAIMISPSEAIKLVVFMLEDPSETIELRSFCVELLRRLNCYNELIEIYNRANGSLALALAFALGENGIYLGIPRLISALGEKEKDLRFKVGNKLKEYTGEDYIPSPSAPLEEWKKAAQKYDQWWLVHRESILAYTKSFVSSDDSKKPQRIKALQYWLQANDCWKKNQFLFAEKYLQQALKTDPTYSKCALSLGILLSNHLNRKKDAVKLFEALAMGKYPNESDELFTQSMYRLGIVKRELGQWEDSVSWLRRACKARDSFISAYLELGDTYYKWALSSSLGNDIKKRKEILGEAAQTYTLGLEVLSKTEDKLVPVPASQLYGTDEIPFSRRDYMVGIKNLKERLLRLKKSFLEKSAKLYLAVGNLEKAESQARKAVKLDTKDANLHLLLGMVFERKGQQKEAAREYRIVLRIDPKNRIALQGKKRLGVVFENN